MLSINTLFDVLERSLVGLRREFDRILPWGVLYLISKLKLVFLYLIKLIKLIKNLIKTLNKIMFGTDVRNRSPFKGAPLGIRDPI